jgi:hypothetical protein
MEPTHLDSNPRFVMCVTYLWLIILSVIGNVTVDSKVFLVTDFVNLKIKPTSFLKVVIGI